MKNNKRYLILSLISFATMLAFQNCASPKSSDTVSSPDSTVSVLSGNGHLGPVSPQPPGVILPPGIVVKGGPIPVPILPGQAPSSLSDPKSAADAAAICTKALGHAVKHNGDLGNQSIGREVYQIIAMNSAGTLSSGTRILIGSSDTPEVDEIGDSSSATLVLCNLHVKLLDQVNYSRVILVNSQIDQLEGLLGSRLLYDSNSAVGGVGKVVSSLEIKLK